MDGARGGGTRAQGPRIKGDEGQGSRCKGSSQGTRAKGEVQGARAKDEGQRLRIKVHRVSDKGLLGLSCYVLWPSFGSLGALYGLLGDRSHPIGFCLAKTVCFMGFGGFFDDYPLR